LQATRFAVQLLPGISWTTLILPWWHSARKLLTFVDLFEGDEVGGEDFEKERHYLLSVATKAREKVRLFEWYTREFAPLFENYPGSNTPPGSNFPVLFQNDETAHALKKKILGYCGGLPDEEDVTNLRAASLHLFVTLDPYERGVPYQQRGLPRFERVLPNLDDSSVAIECLCFVIRQAIALCIVWLLNAGLLTLVTICKRLKVMTGICFISLESETL
jgi:hypothetical protein